MDNKYRYIGIAAFLLLLLVLGVVYLMDGSQGQSPQSPTSINVDSSAKSKDIRIPLMPPAGSVVPIADFSLVLVEPNSLDIVVKETPIIVRGRTRIDALVTVNEYVVEPDIKGWFEQKIDLKSGLNVIEIVASVASGEQKSIVLGAGYISK